MKTVKCNYFGCIDRKRGIKSDKDRSPNDVFVPDEFDGPAYCSVECAIYDGAITKTDTQLELPPPNQSLQ